MSDHVPARPRTPTWPLVTVAVAVFLLVLAGVLLRTTAATRRIELSAKIVPVAPPAPAASPATAPAPRMPPDAVEITLHQRRSSEVPGSHNTVFVRIGDITGGQTLVTVTRADDTPLLPNTSLRHGGSKRFRVDGREYKLTAKQLTNLLVGEDFATLTLAPTTGPALTEPQKIDRLIAHVEQLEGATFVRNGAEHTPAQAAAHLRTKRKSAGSRVQTADDFITAAATRSSLTGNPYTVRLPDGTEQEAAALLRAELDRLESEDDTDETP